MYVKSWYKPKFGALLANTLILLTGVHLFTPSTNAHTLKVGVYRTSSIGDVVLATACLDLLGKLDIPTKIHWIGRHPSLQLIAEAYPHVNCISVNEETNLTEVVSQLSGLHFLIDLQTNLRSRFITYNLKKDHGVPVYSCWKNSFRRGRYTLAARIRGRRTSLPKRVLTSPEKQYQLMLNCLIHSVR